MCWARGVGGGVTLCRAKALDTAPPWTTAPGPDFRPSSRGRPCRDCISTAGDSNNESNRRSS